MSTRRGPRGLPRAGRRLKVTVTGASRAPHAARALGAWLERAAPPAARGDVAIALLPDTRVRALNRQHRQVDQPTDVLSFAAETVPARRRRGLPTADANLWPERHLGDIAIALGVAGRQARSLGHSLRVELRVLALHGLLHLLGYDHGRDEGEMERVEERLRRRAGLPAGLIARASRPDGT